MYTVDQTTDNIKLIMCIGCCTQGGPLAVLQTWWWPRAKPKVIIGTPQRSLLPMLQQRL